MMSQEASYIEEGTIPLSDTLQDRLRATRSPFTLMNEDLSSKMSKPTTFDGSIADMHQQRDMHVSVPSADQCKCRPSPRASTEGLSFDATKTRRQSTAVSLDELPAAAGFPRWL